MPNIRIEPIETMQTGRHLSEFRQVDIEEAFVTYENSMSLAEELIYHVCTEVRNNCNGHLLGLNGDFVVPIPPFERIRYLDMLKHGIPRSAGFGIGVERLTRWVCGLDKIWEATPFPKVPGVISP
jgi:aspartyl/asparaginyl-tRNA synthetase